MKNITQYFCYTALTTALLSLAACAHNPSAPTLSGTWQVTSLTGEPTPDNHSVLEFDPARHSYHAYFGCNHFQGQYEQHGHTLKLGQAAGTLMMCSNIEDERTGMGTLEFVQQWRIIKQDNGSAARLQLLDDSGRVRIEAIAQP